MKLTTIALGGCLLLVCLGCRPAASPPPKPTPVPVTSETVVPAPFRASLNLLATVEPAATVELRAPTSGRLYFPQSQGKGSWVTGGEVREGQVLFAVENPRLEQAVREAELKARASLLALERTRKGVDGGFMPKADLAQQEIEHELAVEYLESARDDVDRLQVRAPLSGVLRIDAPRPAGSEVDGGTLLAELAVRGALRLEGWATAFDLERLPQQADVECLDSAGERVLGRGRLAEVDRRLDPGGVARVVAVIDEDRAMPAQGSGVMMRILLQPKERSISVPVRSLVLDGSLTSVFVLEASGSEALARARLVQVGDRHGDRVEVLDGLAEGEKVAVEGADLLADGLSAKDVSEQESVGAGR